MKANDDFEARSERLRSWDVPEKYFEGLEDKVIEKWQSTKPASRNLRLWKWLWIPGSVAASFLIFYSSHNPEPYDLEVLFDDEELAYYYMYTSEEVGEEELWYDFSDIELDDVESWLTKEDFNVEILNELY